MDGRYKHGMSHKPVYKVWKTLRQRCSNPNNKDFKYYGGRGITFCDSWENFSSFYEDMGDCPSGMSLDRIDTNLGYFKENCRWADSPTQNYNQVRKKTNKSGKTGVSWNSRREMWCAQINVDGDRIHLGCFNQLEDAVKAREGAEINYFGFLKGN